MYRLGACMPILEGFFLIYVLIWKKDTSELLRQVAPKHTASNF